MMSTEKLVANIIGWFQNPNPELRQSNVRETGHFQPKLRNSHKQREVFFILYWRVD